MYRPYNPEQRLLFPEDVRDYLGPSHEANLIYEAVTAVFEAEPAIRAKFSVGHSREGRPAFDPEMMVCLLCYAYAIGVRSSRKVARLPVRDLGAYWLTAGERPDFRTVSVFRTANHEALEELFAKVLVLAGQLGMLKIGALTLDGTKIRANADSSMSTMESLNARLKECRQTIAKILKEAEEVDASEGRLFGDSDGTELDESLTSKQSRRKHLSDVASKLRQAGDRKAARKLDANRDLVERLCRAKTAAKGQKQQKGSGTDPDARFVKLEFGKIQPGYNAQAVVEEGSKIIVGAVVLQDANDSYAAGPAMDDVEKHLGRGSLSGRQLIADHGYFYAPDIEAFEAKGVDALVMPDGEGNRKFKIPKDERKPTKVVRGDFIFHDHEQREKTFYTCPSGRKLHYAGTEWLDSATKAIRRARRRGWKYQSANCRGCPYATRCLGYTQEQRKRRLLRDPLTDGFKDQMRDAFKKAKVRKRYTTRMYTVEPVFGEMKDKRGLRRFNLRGLHAVTIEWRWSCLTHNLLTVARKMPPKSQPN